MPKMLADGKDTLWVLPSLPSDPTKPTKAEINGGDDASCSVGKAGFVLGAGSPNTTTDGGLCDEGEMQIPTSKTYEASMNVFRFFDNQGQIDGTADFLFDALREFGSEVILAYRDGGKKHTEQADEDDEVSIYKVISGGMGRATDRSGYSKRVAHISVVQAWEDVKVVSGT